MSGPSAHTPRRPLIWPDAIRAVQDALAGMDTPVYIVGGAVRDAYLHRPVKDIDLAVPVISIKVARQIANALDGDIFVLDSERGVARALLDTPDGKLTIDVARFRGDSLLDDLTDRDFTLNAMAVDLSQDLAALIDPLNGEQDASDKLIRRCTPHAISDDPIRALRAVRQSVQLRMRIEPETLKDIRHDGPRLVDTSAERIRDEFINLLNVSKPATALRIADSLGLLELILPEIKPLHDLPENDPDHWTQKLAIIERLTQIMTAISPARTEHTAASFHLGLLVMQFDRYRAQLQAHLATTWPNERPQRVLLILAALLYRADLSTDIAACSEALRLSNDEQQRMGIITRDLTLPALDKREIHRFWYRLDAAGVDICLLTLAHYLGTADVRRDQDGWLRLVEQVQHLLEAYYVHYDELVSPPPLVNGHDVMNALHLNPGPIIHTLLTLIREEQAVGNVTTADDALRVARDYLEGQDSL